MSFVYWLIITGVLLVIEMISLGLTTIWFAGGALLAAVLSFFGIGLVAQLVAFIALSLVMFIFTRPIAMKYFFNHMEKTNIDALPGKIVLVTETVDNQNSKGTVKLNGLEWSARSLDGTVFEKGQNVKVNSIDGVKLIVERNV